MNVNRGGSCPGWRAIHDHDLRGRTEQYRCTVEVFRAGRWRIHAPAVRCGARYLNAPVEGERKG
jgi:hypothetical protein